MAEHWTTGRLAAELGLGCDGAADVPLCGVGALDAAGPGQLSFCTGGRWLRALGHTRASAVIVESGVQVPTAVVPLRAADPRLAFARAAALLAPAWWPRPGVHPAAVLAATATSQGATVDALAVVEEGATVAPGAWIQSHAYVGRGATVGAGCRLMPHSVVMDGCVLEAGVWLQPGAIIGADGFGHAGGPGGVRIPQLGHVHLEEGVEVGANACVDRAALGETRIGARTRLDNLVQIAHGVRVGADTLLAAFTGVAGSATLGSRVRAGGRSSVVDGVVIGDDATLAAATGVTKDVEAGARVGGAPARRYRDWLRESVALRQLPRLLRAVAAVERRLEELERDRT